MDGIQKFHTGTCILECTTTYNVPVLSNCSCTISVLHHPIAYTAAVVLLYSCTIGTGRFLILPVRNTAGPNNINTAGPKIINTAGPQKYKYCRAWLENGLALGLPGGMKFSWKCSRKSSQKFPWKSARSSRGSFRGSCPCYSVAWPCYSVAWPCYTAWPGLQLAWSGLLWRGLALL